MANYLILVDKTTKSVVSMREVDKEICALLDIPQDDKYCGGKYGGYDWYDTIGYQLASGKTYDQVRLFYAKSTICYDSLHWLMKCINYLEEKYESKNYYSY